MKAFRLLGIAIQALVLGAGLLLAILRIYGTEVGAQVFRYVGF
ncbi:MAG: hypothetical protein BIFFINMI_03501 [Phycisphaerae bacterium]|nr:hypothetical protein [Phycisphaerae bacterium]